MEFLRHLFKHISDKLLVMLPAYSPDLNPDEGVWQYLKCVCLKNICCKNIDQLKHELKKLGLCGRGNM